MLNLANPATIKELCARHGFAFSKSLGQNFLINPDVCPKIAELGNASKDFGIIEIGTGFGVLSAELCKRAKKVVAIEIDEKLISVLTETMAEYENFKVITADVLKVDIRKLIEDEFQGLRVAVCANLPYYITSPIVMGLLEQRLPIESITVMVQKEAATRLCANPGTRECGAVTAAVHYYSSPKLLFNVSRGSFLPAPNVDSAVIRLDVRQEPVFEVSSEELLFKLIRSAFSQRRKMMANPVSGGLGLKKSLLLELMEEVGISKAARAEELTLEQFIALANRICLLA